MISKGIRSICEDYTKIENYEEAIHDIDETWVCHHRLEISPMGKIFSAAKLEVLGLYYKQPPEALIFLTHAEHARLHNIAKADYKGRKPKKEKRTKEELHKIKSENSKSLWQKRKEEGWAFSDEALQKMSKAKKGRNPWNKGKKGAQHHSEETKKKISERMKGGNSTSWKKGQAAWNKGMPGHTKGKKHYTNGVVNIFAYECPAGFREGWIKKNG